MITHVQTINVHFGGTLHQHINSEYSSESRGQLVHQIVTKEGRKFKTNSLHHQAINKPGDGIVIEAWTATKGDGNIEAISHKTYPLFGVQFHPEEIYDDYSIEKVKKLLKEEYLQIA